MNKVNYSKITVIFIIVKPAKLIKRNWYLACAINLQFTLTVPDTMINDLIRDKMNVTVNFLKYLLYKRCI